MNSLKPIVVLVSTLFVVTLMVPALLVVAFSTDSPDGELAEELQQLNNDAVIPQFAAGPSVEVSVYRSKTKNIEQIPLEEYIVGVVASEMPAEFELEALKAQALSARTYIVKQMLQGDSFTKPEGSNVTDTPMHQVYKSIEELKQVWGVDFDWKIQRITEAVKATQGQIITYNNTPIDASFFSTSNGYTENSEAYWQNPFPYLKSVESPWDETSPKFFDQKTITVTEFEQRLGVKLKQDGSVGTIIGRTPGKRVDTVEINGQMFSGREIRENLDLRSTDFTWVRKGNEIAISTKGYGHGVGMSQYGANGMAQEGKNYVQIVTYYYQGVEVSAATQFLTKITAQN